MATFFFGLIRIFVSNKEMGPEKGKSNCRKKGERDERFHEMIG